MSITRENGNVRIPVKEIFGDEAAGNYVIIFPDGTFRLVGEATTFLDALMPLTQSRQGALAKPDFDFTNVGYLFPQNDSSEVLYAIYQLNHYFLEGSNLVPHIHWTQSSADLPVFKIAYKWYNNGAAVPGSWTTVADTGTPVYTYTSGSIGQISTFAPLVGTGKEISSILKIKLYRDDNVLTGDVLADSFDFHMQSDGFGSAEPWAKKVIP